jgi:hypothetical protein
MINIIDSDSGTSTCPLQCPGRGRATGSHGDLHSEVEDFEGQLEVQVDSEALKVIMISNFTVESESESS